MKKLLTALLIVFALNLSVVPVMADQYGDDGGEVLGEQVDEQPEHEPVDAGIEDMQFWQVMLFTAGVAVVATAAYKASYKLYIFDR